MEKDTYIVTIEIMDGENTYFVKQMVSLSDAEPEDELFIKEIYGDIPYDKDAKCWDIGWGEGYPLASVYSYQVVEPQHINILNNYGIC